jgi:halocyanin-like protein
MRHISYLGVAMLTVAVVLAGCLGPDPSQPGTPTYLPVEPNYKGWFDGVSNYEGTVDERGKSDVTVLVGARGDSGYYKFDAPAIAVSPGTTVTWIWTGKGGTHNVVAESGQFDSGGLVDREGYTYSYTFEEPGVYYYVCEPHEMMGMKGAVFVALDEAE